MATALFSVNVSIEVKELPSGLEVSYISGKMVEKAVFDTEHLRMFFKAVGVSVKYEDWVKEYRDDFPELVGALEKYMEWFREIRELPPEKFKEHFFKGVEVFEEMNKVYKKYARESIDSVWHRYKRKGKAYRLYGFLELGLGKSRMLDMAGRVIDYPSKEGGVKYRELEKKLAYSPSTRYRLRYAVKALEEIGAVRKRYVGEKGRRGRWLYIELANVPEKLEKALAFSKMQNMLYYNLHSFSEIRRVMDNIKYRMN